MNKGGFMAGQTRVVVADSVEKEMGNGWKICFQWCLYKFPDHEKHGYRFIWKRPNGNLQAARGQARLPDMDIIMELIETAKKQGWGYKGDIAMEEE